MYMHCLNIEGKLCKEITLDLIKMSKRPCENFLLETAIRGTVLRPN